MLDAYKRCRDYLDQAIAIIKPGVTTGDVAALWPKAEEFGFPNEEAAFGLQYGHGIGLAIWERPVISRLVSIEYPEVIQEGMVFALETFWPAKSSHHAARIEEEMVVTADGRRGHQQIPGGGPSGLRPAILGRPRHAAGHPP